MIWKDTATWLPSCYLKRHLKSNPQPALASSAEPFASVAAVCTAGLKVGLGLSMLKQIVIQATEGCMLLLALCEVHFSRDPAVGFK